MLFNVALTVLRGHRVIEHRLLLRKQPTDSSPLGFKQMAATATKLKFSSQQHSDQGSLRGHDRLQFKQLEKRRLAAHKSPGDEKSSTESSDVEVDAPTVACSMEADFPRGVLFLCFPPFVYSVNVTGEIFSQAE